MMWDHEVIKIYNSLSPASTFYIITYVAQLRTLGQLHGLSFSRLFPLCAATLELFRCISFHLVNSDMVSGNDGKASIPFLLTGDRKETILFMVS